MREELERTSADALFTRGEADRLLARKSAQEELEKIVKSERGDHRLRVLAHELLLALGRKPEPRMARIYSEAIAGAFMHNWWGLPGGSLGKLGETLVGFGEAAIPHLVKEMDDPAPLTFLGPDAPKNRERHYCVGDLAAWLACTILKRDYSDGPQPESRLAPRTALMHELQEELQNNGKKK